MPVGAPEGQGAEGALFIIDERLESLLPGLRLAVETRKTIIVLQLWRRTSCVALLPFHLHARWPDAVRELPLSSVFGIVPFSQADLLIADLHLYSISEASCVRKEARKIRHQENRLLDSDLQITDWEQGFGRHHELAGTRLSGTAYVAIDRVSPEGAIVPGHRALGRIAVRVGIRPSVLVPPRSGVKNGSADCLAGVDVLVVNLQSLRGRKVLEGVGKVLKARGVRRATLIVGASPSDILAAGLEGLARDAQISIVGSVPRVAEVEVTDVGRDRLLAERSFAFGFEDLPVSGPQLDRVLELAKSAWWAIRQSLSPNLGDLPEVRRFSAAVDNYAQESSTDATQLTAGVTTIREATLDVTGVNERRQAVVDVVLSGKWQESILVLTRDSASAVTLRNELSRLLDVPVDGLETLGVYVQNHRLWPPDRPISQVVASGYFGQTTIDVMLAARAPNLHLILDPIEARVAFFGVERLINYLNSSGLSTATPPLIALKAVLAVHAPSAEGSIAMSLGLTPSSLNTSGRIQQPLDKPVAGEVAVLLTDGSRLDVSAGSRFEVLGHVGGRMRTVSVSELQPGDEIVLLFDDSRIIFSEKVIETIDRGPLRPLAEKRSQWLTIVSAIYRTTNPNLATVTRRMAELGQVIDYGTVRSWVTFEKETEAAVPESRERFLAFADAIGIRIAPDDLIGFYSAIRALRVRHRLVGRELARAIRAAYLGRMDAGTRARIERQWGINAVQLLEAAHVGTVDEVIFPEGDADAAN